MSSTLSRVSLLLSSYSTVYLFKSISHLLLKLWGITCCPATSLSSSLPYLWSRLMKCYKVKEAVIFSEASDMGRHRQSGQMVGVIFSSPSLDEPGTVCTISCCCALSCLCMWQLASSYIEINDSMGNTLSKLRKTCSSGQMETLPNYPESVLQCANEN